MRPLLLPILAVTLIGSLPATVAADGLPLPVEDTGPSGVPSANGIYRYVSIPAGDGTVVERTVQNGGAVSDSLFLGGEFTIPAVALDGSAAGLSTDGETLVLIRPRARFPRSETEFAVLDAGPGKLRLRRMIELEGDFSFDALSPDGETMFLIEYFDRRDPSSYHVRAYDLRRDRLLPGAITDPREAAEEMYGFALARQSSDDGRWAYTLYWGREHPFVHALDTTRARAVCIDLDRVGGTDMYALGLERSGDGTLIVTNRGRPAASVDTESFTVGPPPAAEASAAAGGDADGGVAWEAWLAIAGGIALLAAVVALVSRHRGGDPAPT